MREMPSWDEYFLSEDIDIIRFTVWHLVFFAVFTGSWIPIWRQSEKRQPRYPSAKARKKKKVQKVVVYGYQTRKRREWRAKLWARWVLMNPDYFYNGLLWTIVYLCAAAGCYYAQTKGEEGNVRTVALSLASWQAGIFGIWTIAPFYWDMPGWGVLHLAVVSFMSIGVSILFAYLDWWAFGLYTVFAAAQTLLTIIYGGAFLFAITDGRPFDISNPLFSLLRGSGLHPVSYLEKDGYLPPDPLQEEEESDIESSPAVVPSASNRRNTRRRLARQSTTSSSLWNLGHFL